MKLDIIYRTDDFIIIYKPCGISVHKDQSEIGLTTLVAEQQCATSLACTSVG